MILETSNDPSRARAVRFGAAVLFLSGAVIGGTLGRVSAYLLPPSQRAAHAPLAPLGQISRALQPGDTVPSASAPAISARAPEIKASAQPPLESPPPPSTATASSPEPDVLPASPEPAVPTPKVTLINPGAAEPERVDERSAQRVRAPRDEAATSGGSRRQRDRRAASNGESDEPKARESESRRDYRSLRQEMLRR
jgi:hypothetical protein